MKTIGILGGLGPESTIEYYRGIIRALHSKTPDSDYPQIIIYSANMTELWKIIQTKRFDTLVTWLTEKIKSLHDAGADFAVIASNTPHIVFEEVKSRSPIPMLSIVEETCKKAESLGLKKCGLFGTGFTMQSSFYQDYFSKKGISIVVPENDAQKYLNEKIFSELEEGIIKDQTRNQLLKIVKKMIETQSIDSLLLACTELPLILNKDEYGIPFLSTTAIHIESIVKYCISANE
jgi:aspartate racemase